MTREGQNGDELDIREFARMLHSQRTRPTRDPAGDRVFDAVEELAGKLKTDETGERLGTLDDPQIVPRVKVVDDIAKTERKKFANWVWKAGELHDVAAKYRALPDPKRPTKIAFYIWVQYPPGSDGPNFNSILATDPNNKS